MAIVNRRRTRPERAVSGRVLGMMYRVGMLAPLLLFVFTLISAITVFVLMVLQKIDFDNAMKMLGVSVVSMIIMFWIMLSRMRNRLLDPLSRLEASIARVISGEPNTHISLHAPGVLRNMVEDIRSINDELNELYDDMDQRVAQQTSRLAQKTASLKILYDVAASINQADSLDELLLRFLRILKQMVNAQAATVRLMQPNGVLRLVGAMGPNNQILREREMLPLDLCVCGKALSPGDILCENRELHCVNKLGRTMFTDDQIEKVTVNLEYQDQLLGQYQLHVAKKGLSEREDILQLLETIGSHLGMAVAKQSSDIEARRLSLVDERTALAHELHDSLAQTLASLRFQVRLLQDEIKKGNPEAIADDMLRLKGGIDEAHDELRELLHSFRAPVDQKGLANALETMAKAFEKDTGVKTFFQKEWTDPKLSPSEEVQIMRIAQEALANIRKHAKPNVVRMLLTYNKDKGLALLVEDDGVGFDSGNKEGKPGEHVGLTIMEERADRLGATLRIESESGEGTQVELHYQPSDKSTQPEKALDNLMRILMIDDHALFRMGLGELLERRGIEVIAALGNCHEGIDKVAELEPDVVLLDMRMPQMNGLQVLIELRQRGATMPIVMLTTSRDESDVVQSLQNGANGYLLKDMEPDELIEALKNIVAGQTVVAPDLAMILARALQGDLPEPDAAGKSFTHLTKREKEILCLLADGQSNKLIARNLGISDGTVKLHVKSILRKLDISSRVEAAVIAVEQKLCARNVD